MQKISNKKDCEVLCGLPPPVICKIEETVAMLNFYYGENRNIDRDLGGYVLLIETESDFKNIQNIQNIFSEEIQALIPEFTGIIKWQGETCYTASLILISSDFSVMLIIPYNITPQSFFEYIKESDGA